MSVSEKRKRPVWFWIILIWSGFGFLGGLITLYGLYYKGVSPMFMTPEQKAYFDSLTIVDYTLTTVIVLANFGAAIALFMFRKAAFYLFTFSLVLNVLVTIHHVVSKDFLQIMPVHSIAISLTLLAVVCLYSAKLMKQGILK